MDVLDAITGFEIAGNNLWRIIELFGTILIAFVFLLINLSRWGIELS